VKQLYGNLAISEAFSKADDILATAARGIAEIITVPGYINVDFKDVNTVMKNSGVSIMGYAEAEGVDRAKTAIEMAINSPLLEDNDIRGAQHILLNISSGSTEVTMDEITEITEYIEEEAGTGTDMIWGNCVDDTLGDKISVTLIATGFDKRKEEVTPPRRVGINDGDLKEITNQPNHVFNIEDNKANVVEFDSVTVSAPKSTTDPYIRSSVTVREDDTDGNGAVRRVVKEPRRESQRPARPLDSPKDIGEMEEVPAYKRKRISLEDRDEAFKESNSKLSINIDDLENPRIERNNSFFHNNVD